MRLALLIVLLLASGPSVAQINIHRIGGAVTPTPPVAPSLRKDIFILNGGSVAILNGITQ